MTKTAAYFGTTFQQLWILIHQLEELNIQFAEFLQTLPIPPLSPMILRQPSAEPLTQLTQLKKHPKNRILTLPTLLQPTQAVHHLTHASYHWLPLWPSPMTPSTTGITKHQAPNPEHILSKMLQYHSSHLEKGIPSPSLVARKSTPTSTIPEPMWVCCVCNRHSKI